MNIISPSPAPTLADIRDDAQWTADLAEEFRRLAHRVQSDPADYRARSIVRELRECRDAPRRPTGPGVPGDPRAAGE